MPRDVSTGGGGGKSTTTCPRNVGEGFPPNFSNIVKNDTFLLVFPNLELTGQKSSPHPPYPPPPPSTGKVGSWRLGLRFEVYRTIGRGHRLTMELDLQSLFGFHACANLYTHWLRSGDPPTPLCSWTIYEGAWSAKIDDISLWSLVVDKSNRREKHGLSYLFPYFKGVSAWFIYGGHPITIDCHA